MALLAGTFLTGMAATELVLDTEYSGFTLANPTLMQWTAPGAGILTARQTGTSDTHLFLNENCTEEFPSNAYTGANPYILSYEVKANTTYYFKALTSQTDDLKTVTYSFESIAELNSVSLGETLQLNRNSEVYAFTPEETGVLTINTNTWSDLGFTILYTDPTHIHIVNYLNREEITTNGWSYEYFVVAGETYYLYIDQMEKVSVTLASLDPQEMKVTITDILPVQGSTIDVNDQLTTVNIAFSLEIENLGPITIDYTNKNDEPVQLALESKYYEIVAGGRQLALRIYDGEIDGKGNTVYNRIKADANESLPWTINISSITFAGNGVLQQPNSQFVLVGEGNSLKVEYQFIDAPTLVSESWPEIFYGYWAPGNETAIATLEYDQEISSVSEVMVIAGTHSWGGSSGEGVDPTWNIRPTFSGNTITINFAGVNYNNSITQIPEYITVFVNGIRTVDGFTVPVVTQYIPFSSETIGEAPAYMNYATPTPAMNTESNPLNSISEITLDWEDDVTLVEGVEFLVEGNLGSEQGKSLVYEIEGGNLVIFVAELLPEEYEGILEVNVPAGLVKNSEGDVNRRQFLTYYLSISSGITQIELIDSDSKEIYNLQGVKMTDKNLKPGIYIINGKKVIIK